MTVSDFGEYTGVHGVVTMDGAAIADVEYDCSWSRTTAAHSRSGKHSDIQVPGKLSVKTTIKKTLVHADAAKVIGYTLSDTPLTGTASTLLASSHVLDATDNYEDMTTPTIATPSRIRYTLGTNATTVAGTITIIGEDANGDAQSETLDVAAGMTVGSTLTSEKLYSKVYGHTIREVDSTSDTGVFAVTSITGSSTTTVGDPKTFALVGQVVKGGNSITLTQNDCWFSQGGLSFADAGKIVEVSLPVEMHDPDTLTAVIVTA